MRLYLYPLYAARAAEGGLTLGGIGPLGSKLSPFITQSSGYFQVGCLPLSLRCLPVPSAFMPGHLHLILTTPR